MKKLVALMLIASLGLTTLVGCSSKEESATSTATTETTETDEVRTDIVFANYRDIRDPNPHLYQGEMWFQEMVYETLVSVEDTGIEPCLAETWDVSEDGLIYTFNIREGVVFSDGYICDAYAIEANFDAIWDNKERHAWLESMNVITGYEATDESTFIITLSDAYYPLLNELGVTRPFAMCSPNVMIDGTTANGVTEYIGSGPYVLVDNVVDEWALFEYNENWWGEEPAIKTVLMKVIPDNQTRVMALETGEVDLIYGAELLDAETLTAYEDNESIIASTSDASSTRQLIMNGGSEILEDINVRYALSHAVNKEAISEGVFYGIEEPADFLYSQELTYCGVELEAFAYDVELAKQYLEEAGWVEGSDGIRVKDGTRLSLGLLYDMDSVSGKVISEYLQSEWKNIGVEIVLEGLERETYFDALKAGTFDIAHNIAWGTPYDPESSLAAMLAPVYGDYAAQLSLPNKTELDAAITSVFVTVDEEERQELYDYILTELHESAIYIPLTYENNKSLYTSSLNGVNYEPSLYTVPFWDMYFE